MSSLLVEDREDRRVRRTWGVTLCWAKGWHPHHEIPAPLPSDIRDALRYTDLVWVEA